MQTFKEKKERYQKPENERTYYGNDSEISNLYRKILDCVPTAIFWKDRDLKYLGCNSAYENFYLLREREIVGKTTFEILPGYYAEDAEVIEKNILSGDTAPKSKTMQVKNRWGDKRWVRTTRVPILRDGDYVVAIVGVAEDITTEVEYNADVSRYSQELQNAVSQAENANKAKTEFLSRMSHEIRTHLSAVIGLTQVAQDSEDITLIKDMLTRTQSASNNLMDIVNDLLDMAKIEADKMTIVKNSFALEQMLQETFDVITESAEEKGLHLVVSLDPKLPKNMIGDKTHLSQVLMNLLSNAVKFTDDGGHISVKIRQEKRENGTICVSFSVKDDGIGMSEELISKLFRPFEQEGAPEAHATPEQREKGTGLGLHIARRLVSLMDGGEISVQSKLGVGSEFTFTLPFEADPSDESTLDLFVQELAGKTVLIIGEYSKNNGSGYLTHLEEKGANLIYTKVGEEALEIIHTKQIEQGKIDLMIIDLSLEDVNAFIIQSIARQQRGKKTLLITSGIDATRRYEIAKNTGIENIINTPLLPCKMLDAIHVAMGSSKEEKHILSTPDFSNSRIMIVEDIAVNREVLQHFLSETKIIVDEAVNGEQAVALYLENDGKYDAIFMDVQMPVMNGYEATIAIREIEESTGRHVPIYAITASAYDNDIRRCLNVGMDAHISKPFQKAEIFNTIAKAINLKQTGSNFERRREDKPIIETMGTDHEELFEENRWVDWQKGIERMMGDTTFYLKLLESFEETTDKSLTLIAEAFEQNDFVTLQHEFHALKGTTQNLSLIALYEIVQAMDEKAKQNIVEIEDIEKLKDVYNQTIEQIHEEKILYAALI